MFTWTRKLFRTTKTAKAQDGLRFRPQVDGLELRLQPAVQGLGAAGQFAVLGMTNGEVDLTRATVAGDVGLGPKVQSSFTNSATTGTLYRDPTAKLDNTGLTKAGGTTTVSLAQAMTDANAASAAYAALSPTQNINNLNKDQTITGTGDVNVINVNTVDYARGDVLTLVGGPNDVFIFNVSGKFNFHSGAIQLDANVPPEHVLWNFPTGNNDEIGVSGENSVWKGTILAPKRSVADTRTGNFMGAIIAKNVDVRAGDQVHLAVFTPPTGGPTQGNSSLSGTLYLNGAPNYLPGAVVTLTNLSTMVIESQETDSFGNFSFTNLSAGTYSLTITQDDLNDVTGGLSQGVGTPGTHATYNGTAVVGGITGIVVDNDDVGTGFNLLALSAM